MIMRLSLIGMSGSGKSSWSIKLSELGFKRFCCDDMITEKLAGDLARPDGTLMQLGEWMGFPYEPDYERRESKYLACEINVLTSIIESIEKDEIPAEQNIVIDTTGSAVYAGEALLKRLCRCTTVVHLETPSEAQEQMLRSYLKNKRPVLWRGLFEKKPEETNETALARCYALLLDSRERLYERVANVTIDYYTLNQDGFKVSDFLAKSTPPI
jgi:shikimate kinase